MSHGRCLCGRYQFHTNGQPLWIAYCHCESCRSWLGAPIHAASLWPTPNVTIARGEEKLGVYKRTEASHRHFCTDCGAPVLIRHPMMGLTDVPAGSIPELDFQASVHVHYGEKVLSVRDGLPKFEDLPGDFGGSGEMLPE